MALAFGFSIRIFCVENFVENSENGRVLLAVLDVENFLRWFSGGGLQKRDDLGSEFCSRCAFGSPVLALVAPAFSFGFFHPVTPKNSYFLAFWYNIVTPHTGKKKHTATDRETTQRKFSNGRKRYVII